VGNTQASTSPAGGSDSDSSVFSFSVTTPIVGYSGDFEWILNTGATIMYAQTGIGFLTFRS